MTDEREGDGRHGHPRRRQELGRTGARFPRIVETGQPNPPAPREPPDAAPGDRPTPASTALVGRTGARFNSRARRDRLRLPAGTPALTARPGPGAPEDADHTDGVAAADPPSGPDPMVGRTGARFASRGREARRRAAREALEDAVVPVQAAPTRERYDPIHPRPDEAPTAPLHLAELRTRVEGYETRVSVRPYVRTRGRTRSRPDLLVETLISLPRPRPPLDDPEHVAIGDLCDDAPRSVAEVAALMRVPLGVARVLIGDMADDGSVRIHPTAASAGHGPDRDVLARVLRGLHRL